jgi:hypothetical protein
MLKERAHVAETLSGLLLNVLAQLARVRVIATDA